MMAVPSRQPSSVCGIAAVSGSSVRTCVCNTQGVYPHHKKETVSNRARFLFCDMGAKARARAQTNTSLLRNFERARIQLGGFCIAKRRRSTAEPSCHISFCHRKTKWCQVSFYPHLQKEQSKWAALFILIWKIGRELCRLSYSIFHHKRSAYIFRFEQFKFID